jgi:rhodanese-related sulfurtransferase
LNFLPKKTVKEAIFIFCVALILGNIINIFHPQKVRISFSSPQLKFAEEDSSSEIISKINSISDSEIDKISEPLLFSKVYIKKLVQVDSALLIDSRSFDEYEKGHIPGAMNLPYNSIFENKNIFNKLPKNKWLITYCDGPPCDVAELLAFELFYSGFKRVAIYAGGLNGWKSQMKGENK